MTVPDSAAEDRWADYPMHALADGVGSSLSLPLRVDGATIGALHLYATNAGHFDEFGGHDDGLIGPAG